MQSEEARDSIIVRTVGLRRVYRVGASEVHALRGVDMEVPEGRFVAVMGREAEQMGFKLTAPVGHYTGLDLVDARINPGVDLILRPGASAIIHPVLENGDGVRLFLGQTYLSLEKETSSLNATDDRLLFIS